MNDTLFKDYRKVVIRTPLYSYLNLFNPGNKTKDLDELIHCYLNAPDFMEGLYWSSPQLHQEVLKYKDGAVNISKENKLFQTLKKYLIRACTRCTPYGIYAGSTLTDIGIREAGPEERMKRKVRIDMGLLYQVKCRIESDSAIWPHLRYTINNSFYRIPGQYRFMETIIKNGKCHYQISSLDQTDFLEKVITLVGNATVSVNDIYSLTGDDILYDEFIDFIEELIKTQLLVSELQLGLTIGNELAKYFQTLERLIGEGIAEAKKYITLFSSIENVLYLFEKLPIGQLPLKEIKNLEELLHKCGIEEMQEHLFHADLKKPVVPEFVFEKEKLKEVQKAIDVFGKLSVNNTPRNEQLEQFKKRFTEKYETREIPLSEAMDPEFGIGFPAPEEIGNIGYNSLIDDMEFFQKKNVKARIEKYSTWLQDKMNASGIKELRKDIQLSDDDLKGLDGQTGQLPDTFDVMGTLLPGGKILIQNVGGSHANSLLGRFAYMDEKITSLCKELSETEGAANEQVIFAEIIHLPEGRIGNIARRPALSDYEIPFLASSSFEAEKQILVSDLLVSIHDNEIILRSKRLNKRVIPRPSNAHNYTNSLVPVYKFLSSIQQQGKHGFEINFGKTSYQEHFLPRVSYKNIVLHRAC